MVPFKEIVLEPVSRRSTSVFVIGPTNTSLFMSDDLQCIFACIGCSDGISLLIGEAGYVERRGYMSVCTVSRNLLQFITRGIINILDITFSIWMNEYRKVQIIIADLIDQFVIIGDQVTIAIISII